MRDTNGDIVVCNSSVCHIHRNADRHHKNVLCPYDPKRHFNKLQCRTMKTLAAHCHSSHERAYVRQTKPKPHILLRFDDGTNELFGQCGCCVGFYNLGLMRHKRDELKAHKEHKWQDADALLYYLRRPFRKLVKKVDPIYLWEDTFGRGSYKELQKKVQSCDNIFEEVREYVEWSEKFSEKIGNWRKYYFLRSKKLLELHIGSTEKLLSVRNSCHNYQRYTASNDCELTFLANLHGEKVNLNEIRLKEQLEFFICNTYKNRSNYKFVNVKKNEKIV